MARTSLRTIFTNSGGATTFAIEDESEAHAPRNGGEFGLAGLIRDERFEFGHNLFFEGADEVGINGLVDFEKWQPVQTIDPVILEG